MKSQLPLHHELPLSGLDGDIGRGVDGADPSSDVEPGEGALETTEKKKKLKEFSLSHTAIFKMSLKNKSVSEVKYKTK